jgi:restriction endonuclease S subunit
MQYSVVNKSKLHGNLRIDAEFYSPDFLLLEKILNSHQTEPFSTYSIFVKKGIFDLSPDHYTNQGIPLIRTSEIKDPLIDFSTSVFLDEKTHDANKKTELNPGDIVFTKIGAYIGDVAMLPQKYNRYNFSQNVTGIKLKKDKIDPGFLLAFLLSKYGNQQIKRIIMLSGQGKLELEDIKNINFIRVGDKIESLVQDIVLKAEGFKEKSIGIYQEAEQILLSELGLSNWKPKHRLTFIKNFSDTKSADRINAEYFQPKYDEVINAVKSYSGGWDILDNLVKIKKSIEPGSNEYQEEGIKFLRVSNLSKFGIDNGSPVYLSEKFYNENKQHQPKQGEILLSKDATPGIAYYLNEKPEEMIVSGGILRLKLKDERVNEDYLTLFLNSILVQEQAERDAGGSVIIHWRPDQIKGVVVPIVKDNIQKQIQQKIQQSFESRNKSKQLLEIAKKGVEIAIEKDEHTAMRWIEKQVEKVN